MSEIIKVNPQGLAQSVNTKAITTEYKKINNPINDLFVELLKKIINENKKQFDNSSKSNNLNKEGTIGYIVTQHNGNMPQILAPKSSVAKLKDVYEEKFEYWINGDHKSSIPSNRAKFIDFLLYFNYAEYQNSYENNRKKIDATLEKFSYTPLYLMNYQEFCVLSALKLAKEGEDIYTVFTSLYNNSDFLEMIETPDTERGVEDFEKFTNQIEFDFDKVNHLGSKVDIDAHTNGDNELSLYKFVDLYRHAFGRARLSSLRLLCALILGEKFDDKLFSDKWSDSSMVNIEMSVEKKLQRNNGFFKESLIKLCQPAYVKFLQEYKKNLVNQRIQEYRDELDNALKDDARATIFELHSLTEICRQFLKYKLKKLEKTKKDETLSSQDINAVSVAEKEIKICLRNQDIGVMPLSYQYTKLWHNECEAFFLEKLNKWIKKERNKKDLDSSDVDLVWDLYFNRDESVTRESIIWALILCLRSDVLKELIGGRIAAEDSKTVSKNVLNEINEMLHSVGMLPLNAAWGKHDYLLINAISHTDYKKLYYSDTIYCPYRNYVFEEILANMTTDQKLKEIDKIENELLTY